MRLEEQTHGICPRCEGHFPTRMDGRLVAHGPRGNRCPGWGERPYISPEMERTEWTAFAVGFINMLADMLDPERALIMYTHLEVIPAPLLDRLAEAQKILREVSDALLFGG